jgi:hypothetical protein
MSVIINNFNKMKRGEADERHRRAQSTMVTGDRLHTQRMTSMSTQESLREPYQTNKLVMKFSPYDKDDSFFKIRKGSLKKG